MIQSMETAGIDSCIRHSFLLNEHAVITDAMRSVYQQECESGFFQNLTPLIQNTRNDLFNVSVTHDIDWLNSLHPYSVLNTIRGRFTNHRWLSFSQLCKPDLLLRNIEQLLKLENQLGIQSIFFIGASNHFSLGVKQIRYNYTSGLLKELIQLIHQYQMKIGLHASCKSIRKRTLTAERIRLNELTQSTILYHRAHYIPKFSAGEYAAIASAGFTHDFGLGSSQTISFQNGFAGTTQPVNSVTGQKISLKIVPLVLMDNIFFRQPCHIVFNAFKQQLLQLKQNNGSANILFHPENMLLKPQLYSYFEEIIHLCKEEGATLKPTT